MVIIETTVALNQITCMFLSIVVVTTTVLVHRVNTSQELQLMLTCQRFFFSRCSSAVFSDQQVGSRERNTTNPTTETQTAAATNRPAVAWIYWVFIKSTGRLCLTVDTVILMPPPTSCPAGRLRFLQFRIHTPSPGGCRTRRRTSEPPGAGSGFHLCGRFGTGGGRGPDRGLGQRGEPGGHGRLGAGQSSAHRLT